MENSLKPLLDTSKSVLILLPINPFFDQVAAGLSFYLFLSDKKEVSISCPTPMLVEFNRLVGVNKINSEQGNKNLIIRFVGYRADDIERVGYDIENKEFRLTVTPKAGVTSPKKEQIEFSYSGVSSDLLVLFGGRSEKHFPALSTSDFLETKTVHIGTRAVSTSDNRKIISLARPASSVSEVAATLIKESGFSFNADIASNLLLGIEHGSKNFTVPEVTAETFAIASELMRAGGQRAPRHQVDPRVFPAGAIPKQTSQVNKKEEPPKSWLEPKIYKGNTIS